MKGLNILGLDLLLTVECAGRMFRIYTCVYTYKSMSKKASTFMEEMNCEVYIYIPLMRNI